MKNILFSIVLFLFSLTIFAQEKSEVKASKFGFAVDAKMGSATFLQTGKVDLNGSVNVGKFLFYYTSSDGSSSISLGIEELQFKANGVSAGENYALDQKHLRIPLNYSYSLSILKDHLDEKLQAYAGVGVYANTLRKEKIQTLEETYKNKNQGWNGGFGFEVGLVFQVAKDLNFGIGFETQSDFSKMKKNEIKRKLEGISTVNFRLQFVIN